MTTFFAPSEDPVAPAGNAVIVEVRAYVSASTEYGASDVHDTPDSHWIMGMPDASGGWLPLIYDLY